MSALSDSILLQALGWAVLNSLWQAGLIWVIYQFVLSIFKNVSSSQKSTLATLMVAISFIWFIYTFVSRLISDISTNEGLASLPLFVSNSNEQLNQWLQTSLPFASLSYLILLVFPLIGFLRNYRYVQVLHTHGISKPEVKWRIFVQRIAKQMGIKKPVHLWVSEFITSPVTFGFIKPIILIPLAAVNHLTPQQFEAILLHELSHIKRYDYLINLFLTFVRTILYFNPFIKFFIKTIEKEREKSCDEIVLQFQYDPHGYASALLFLERNNYLLKSMMAIGVGGRKNDLMHRIEKIVGIEKKSFISFNRLAGLFVGLLSVFALNTLLIMSKPSAHSGSFSFQQFSNPFYFFSGSEENNNRNTPTKNEIFFVIKNEIEKQAKSQPLKENGAAIKNIFPPEQPDIQFSLLPQKAEIETPPVINTNFTMVESPELNKYQEEQVDEVVGLSKKILQEKEWKEIENNLADAMTQVEKNQFRTKYLNELEKVDWKKLEDQLKVSYDNLNWDKINDQLVNAVIEMKLDSLQTIYSNAVNGLSKVEDLLADKKGLHFIPDTDITLKKIIEKKQETLKQLNRIKAVRSKKIIHL